MTKETAAQKHQDST